MHELKRFFKGKKKHRSPSPPLTKDGSAAASFYSVFKPSTVSLKQGPDDDDDIHALAQKYGRMGRILGSGAGGSVRLLKRESDGVTFAVKEFRPRRSNEEERDYVKKCTAEFCIGSTLHHPNVINTLDIGHEGDRYYEVMEYCPTDFFAVVMSGQMSRGETNCCFRQICEGVKYLHGLGIAHRDLKLDNCVVKDGIVKLIDFGSAVVFQYPGEEKLLMARGVCGSDPYLAPETLTRQRYDPRFVDIWSIAIIYCCMTLKRFPWKAPKQSDASFQLYCKPDENPHDYLAAAAAHKELLRRRRELRHRNSEKDHGSDKSIEKVTESLDRISIADADAKDKKQEASPHSKDRPEQKPTKDSGRAERTDGVPAPAHRPLQGPYRLMRLLPHAARPIISRMLLVDVSQRATFDDIWKDEWFSEIQPCTVDAKGHVCHVPGHNHTQVNEEDGPEEEK